MISLETGVAEEYRQPPERTAISEATAIDD